jgi:membrane protein implicated in regulation of membrane protease activity
MTDHARHYLDWYERAALIVAAICALVTFFLAVDYILAAVLFLAVYVGVISLARLMTRKHNEPPVDR